MHERKTKELHHHRRSAPQARYFITVCTTDHRLGLTTPAVQKLILQTAMRSDDLGDTETFAFTVMANHVHWLFRLGNRLSLGRVVARLKAETRVGLSDSGLRWQRDFFERRLREEESAEDYGRYIFLNPYRAELLELSAVWMGWCCPKPEQFEFLTRLDADGSVPSQWIGADETSGEGGIRIGRD